jgi:Ca2+-transporting ATPase
MKNKDYYNLEMDEVYRILNSDKEGLCNTEVNKRLEENGYNKLKEEKQKNILLKFLDQFKNVMIIMLLSASIISMIISFCEGESYIDSFIILMVVFLNAVLGVVQEFKAEKAISSLRKMQIPYVKVKRNNKIIKIESSKLVIGDIVIIEDGDYVPADIRIIKNYSIKTDESSLTGESKQISKTDAILIGDIPLADRKNMLYSGTFLVYGHGVGIVVAIGMDTELGKIAQLLNKNDKSLTPLQKKMNEISKFLTIVVLFIGLLLFIVGKIRGNNILEVFMLAVSLAVAAIPEGLPAAITVILSIGVQNMAKEKSVVRNLSSVETLGCTEIICSDKTGTLTQNKMSVTKISIGTQFININNVKMDTIEKLVNCMVLCNNAKKSNDEILGDPTETSLISFVDNLNFDINKINDENNRIYELPFDSNRKMMSVLISNSNKIEVYCKGAVETIINKCNYIYIDNKKMPFTNKIKKEIIENNLKMSKKTLRVLAYAYKEFDNIPNKLNSETIENDLTFIGLSGMIDPPRPEVYNAVKNCFNAGMIPIMITGDNIDTAIAIAEEIGIYKNNYRAITGVELDNMTEEEFEKDINNIRVYARVSPENKLRIVNTWKKLGKVVAMTGDGVNDAPAIKAADIGIGMGITGTEVSKNVSSMIISDDNFASIVKAVEEGRRIYANIQNVITYLLASNLAEIIIIFIGNLMNHNVMLPIQLLWINLITDTIPAITLGFEKAEKNIMIKKPRKSTEKFFTPFLITRIIVPAILKSIIILLLFLYFEFNYNHEIAMTISFICLSFIELLFAHVMRNDKKSILEIGILSNKPLVISTFITILIQSLIIFTPFRNLLNLTVLNKNQYLLCYIIPFLFLVFSEFNKKLIAKYFK